MAEHTPGPWKIGGIDFRAGLRYIETDDAAQFAIAQVSTWDESDYADEALANANLIAAAPDLLDACKAALVSAGDTPDEVRAQLLAAIRKAEEVPS